MTLHDRNLQAGMVLTAPDKYTPVGGEPRTCEVVEKDGGLVFVLDNGEEHASVTMAGRSIDDTRRNGWAFWTREGDDKENAAPAPKREPRPKVEGPDGEMVTAPRVTTLTCLRCPYTDEHPERMYHHGRAEHPRLYGPEARGVGPPKIVASK